MWCNATLPHWTQFKLFTYSKWASGCMRPDWPLTFVTGIGVFLNKECLLEVAVCSCVKMVAKPPRLCFSYKQIAVVALNLHERQHIVCKHTKHFASSCKSWKDVKILRRFASKGKVLPYHHKHKMHSFTSQFVLYISVSQLLSVCR